MMKTVKSLYPLCSHNTSEYKHNFLNAVTVNDHFKRIKNNILRPKLDSKAKERIEKSLWRDKKAQRINQRISLWYYIH